MFKKITPLNRPFHRPQLRQFALVLVLVLGAVDAVQAKPKEWVIGDNAALSAVPGPTPVPESVPATVTPDILTTPAAGALPELNLQLTADNILTPSNPYGLSAIWGQGDLIAKATVLLLGLMSLLSWTLIIRKLLEQRQLAAQARRAGLIFAGPESLQIKTNRLVASSPFRQLTESGVTAAQRHGSLSSQVEMSAWLSQDISRSVGSLQMKTQDGLAVLATVGSTAPFVGLFGTVWGIYNALVTIGISGQASIDKVAGPVGESLIMTALGLAVAVPAILGYNWLVRRNRVSMHGVKWFGSELHTLLLIDIEKSQREPQAKQD
jgi:biopolymer transport protein ExbB